MRRLKGFWRSLVYHSKKYKGTTTSRHNIILMAVVYHSKKYKGTTTMDNR